MLKDIAVERVADCVARLCVDANRHLPCDILDRISEAGSTEKNVLGREIIHDIALNASVADELSLPVCQDTGMAVVFLEIGQDVHFTGGSLYDAVNEGVRRGYTDGLLRKSVVSDPILRCNTGDNTPAVIHTTVCDGSSVKITVAPKGFGSENMSRVYMLTPADGREGIIRSVVDTCVKAGGNPCPPMVVGVGIGGDFEQCTFLSKLALCRSTDIRNENPYYAELEAELLRKINETGIGPQCFGGDTTALAVNVEYAPTHIAGLPVAVNIGCHVTRHKTEVIE